ncbi:NmrA family NAD(P)-binding protein [Baekduia sp. Peel2402]|uniref:NmrA family NAD(P)-binding protein n=1 Tax=Baekduia sp. Peel2402 TaxID=3458296 RepID=UPI00403E8990
MIALLGATGTIGRHVAAELQERGVPVRVLSRPAADLRDVASLRAGMDGADRLFLLTPHDPDQALLEANALAAARDAGIQRIVKVSGGAPSLGPNGPTPTAVAHFASEQAIEASGLAFAFLRSSFMMQNLLATAAPTVARLGLLLAPMGHAPIAMVDARDVASVAVAALLADDDRPGGAWHLTGPAAVSYDDVARLLGVHYVALRPRAAGRALRRQGASAHEVDHALRMAAYFASGADGAPTGAVAELTGRPPRAVAAFLAEHDAAFGTRRHRGVARLLSRAPA